MLTTNEVAQVFDTIMSSPGMNDAVRVDVRVSRKALLLLHQVIEHGVSNKGDGELSLLTNASEETLSELISIGTDCLQKAGLVEMSEKLSQLSNSSKK